MTNCIVYSLIFVLFFNFLIGSTKYSSINRSFESMYRGVFESSTSFIDSSGESIEPYFDENRLCYLVDNYISNEISKYVSSYDLDITFFNKEDNSLCIDGYCRDVKISLSADINAFFTYKKEKVYSIYSKDKI